MSPAAAKILERLGLSDRIVGLGAWVEAPAGTHDIVRVGTLIDPMSK